MALKVGIFGSRSLKSMETYNTITDVMHDFVKKHEVAYFVIPGGITGACEWAFKVAGELLIPAKVYFYGKGTGNYWKVIKTIKERTQKIIDEADYFIFFWDGQSKGTMWDLKAVQKAGKPYELYTIKSKPSAIKLDIEDVNWDL